MVQTLVASAVKSASGNSGILNLGLGMGAPDAANFILNVSASSLADNVGRVLADIYRFRNDLVRFRAFYAGGRGFYFDSSFAVESQGE